MPATTTAESLETATINFVRLPDVDPTQVLALLNEPRNTRHMPLSDVFDEQSARAWVAAKDAQWAEHGYGPWAILVDDTFAGWGGFQHEPNGADFALVLRPAYWGHGAAITRAALQTGFTSLGLDAVLIALPATRNPDRVVRRFGFLPDGDVTYGHATFHQYRLTKQQWARRTTASLDGRVFAALGPTTGDVDAQTRFDYHQDGQVVWAEYRGGAITRGYLLGTRTGDSLRFRYLHLDTAQQTSSGVCDTHIEVLPDGQLRLHETWTWDSRPGSGTTVLNEVSDDGAARTAMSSVDEAGLRG